MDVHRDGGPERRSNGIGSAREFRPLSARPHPGLGRGLETGSGLFGAQHNARRIREHHDCPRLAQKITRSRHDPRAHVQQLTLMWVQPPGVSLRLRDPSTTGIDTRAITAQP